MAGAVRGVCSSQAQGRSRVPCLNQMEISAGPARGGLAKCRARCSRTKAVCSLV